MNRKRIISLKYNWKNWVWWRDKFLYNFLFSILFSKRKGNNIFEEKWNILLILDACRFDVFKEVVKELKLSGILEWRYSMGSATEQFIQKNVLSVKSPDMLKDMIYINTNPAINVGLQKIRKENVFFKMINLWKYYWDAEKGTVLPSIVCKYLKFISKKYPTKRIIAHFLQPHFPFLTHPEIGKEEITASLNFAKKGKVVKGKPFSLKYLFTLTSARFYLNYSSDLLFSLYKSNLKIVINEIKKVLPFLSGKIVITADHGELFGERIMFFKVYGHPHNFLSKKLTKVPWFIIEK